MLLAVLLFLWTHQGRVTRDGAGGATATDARAQRSADAATGSHP